MAEVVGLVASVVQLAGAGLKLSQALYQYADGVATADRRIKNIANEVKLTSFVIQELGNIFKQDETANLISESAVKTADETIKECSAVFTEIEVTVNKTKTGKMGRLMLPFRDNKIELLRSHIDKLKTTLRLLMQVLIHAHQVSSNKLDREAKAKQREDIKQLLENKKQSTQKYEDSLRNFSISDGSTVVDDGERSLHEEDQPVSSSTGVMAALAIGSTMDPETLATCVSHVRSLIADIESLQLALSKRVDGDDHSSHHQKAVGSYILARTHLDSVLLGNSKANLPDTQFQEHTSTHRTGFAFEDKQSSPADTSNQRPSSDITVTIQRTATISEGTQQTTAKVKSAEEAQKSSDDGLGVEKPTQTISGHYNLQSSSGSSLADDIRHRSLSPAQIAKREARIRGEKLWQEELRRREEASMLAGGNESSKGRSRPLLQPSQSARNESRSPSGSYLIEERRPSASTRTTHDIRRVEKESMGVVVAGTMRPVDMTTLNNSHQTSAPMREYRQEVSSQRSIRHPDKLSEELERRLLERKRTETRAKGGENTREDDVEKARAERRERMKQQEREEQQRREREEQQRREIMQQEKMKSGSRRARSSSISSAQSAQQEIISSEEKMRTKKGRERPGGLLKFEGMEPAQLPLTQSKSGFLPPRYPPTYLHPRPPRSPLHRPPPSVYSVAPGDPAIPPRIPASTSKTKKRTSQFGVVKTKLSSRGDNTPPEIVTPSLKANKPIYSATSSHVSGTAHETLDSGNIIADPDSFDFNLTFGDDAGALENFDFDTFLHTGNDDAFGPFGDFDFGDEGGKSSGSEREGAIAKSARTKNGSKHIEESDEVDELLREWTTLLG